MSSTLYIVKCNNYKEMAEKKEHGEIYCGSRGWYSKFNDEYILNELPTLPGEPKNDGKKDPELFNLMPVCRTIRCAIPPAPPNSEFFGCDNSETLNYLPFQSKCELRCKPGFRNKGPHFSNCGMGGNVRFYDKQICVRLAESEITEHEQAKIDQVKPLELILTEVRTALYFQELIPTGLFQPSPELAATTEKTYLPLTSAPPQTGTTPSPERAKFTAVSGIRTANTPAPTAPGTGSILPVPTLATAPVPMVYFISLLKSAKSKYLEHRSGSSAHHCSSNK